MCIRDRPQPDHPDAHDGIPGDHDDRLAVGEDVRHPGRQRQRAGHDEEGQQPIGDVMRIGMIGPWLRAAAGHPERRKTCLLYTSRCV